MARLLIQRGVAGGMFEKAITHYAPRIDGEAKARACGASRPEALNINSGRLDGAERLEFR